MTVATSSQSHGPFDNERDASAASSWARDGRPSGSMTTSNIKDLLDACGSAGVMVGSYDIEVIQWIGGFEPSTCAVIAGLIGRAHSAGWESARAFGESSPPVVVSAEDPAGLEAGIIAAMEARPR